MYGVKYLPSFPSSEDRIPHPIDVRLLWHRLQHRRVEIRIEERFGPKIKYGYTLKYTGVKKFRKIFGMES